MASRPRAKPRRRRPGKGVSAAGRKSMFPGKYAPGGVPLAKISITVTPEAAALLEQQRDELDGYAPEGPKTLSDAAEYCIRRATGAELPA